MPLASSIYADADGMIVMPGSSAGRGRLVLVDAPGHVAVRAPAAPHAVTEVVLWPGRDVAFTVTARDRGVGGVSLELEPRPPADWYGATLLRSYPVTRSRRPGEYRVRLPVCPVHVFATAPGFSDAERDLAADATTAVMGMSPLRGRGHGVLAIESPSAPDGFPLLVANMRGTWYRLVHLRDGRVRVNIPATTEDLQVGSPRAYEGFWHGRQNVTAPAAGSVSKLRIYLSPAVRLRVRILPAVDGTVKVVDVAHEKLAPSTLVPLRNGDAVVWVRPQRLLRIEVDVPGNHFPVRGEITSGREDFDWATELRPAAGLRYRLRDGGGNAIPFAVARVWEPGFGGRILLRGKPRVMRGDAAGVVNFGGLRAGEAAVELRARGFRTLRFAPVRLVEGEVIDGGSLTLEPAGVAAGRVVDPAGKAVAGAWVRVLEPAMARLPMPGGGERDLYDLTASQDGDGATDAAGRFEVPDRSARAPLLAVYPARRSDLTAMAFAPGTELRLAGLARIELVVPGSVRGVYQLLPGGRAVLIANDPPMGLRPMPLVVPAGRVELFVQLRNGKWAAPIVDLKRDETARVSPNYRK